MRSYRSCLWPALVLSALCGAAAAADAPSPALAFLHALSAADSTPEKRQAAWAELKKAGKPIPPEIVNAIDKARQQAWHTLAAQISSAEVRTAGAGLHARIAPYQKRVRDVVGGKGFDGPTLDKAMDPIQKAFDEVRAALKAVPKFAETRSLVSELETYAAATPLRVGWSEELADTRVNELVLARYVAGPRGQETIDKNASFGAWIDPGEYACIARLNVHRLLLGLEPVEIDLRLVIAAKKHSEEMVAKKYFSHTSPTAKFADFGQRASREHTAASGECIAAGSKDGLGAFQMWYNSQPHHQIMIKGTPAVGVGRCEKTWTLMMGGAKARSPEAEKMAAYVRQRYRAGKDPAAILDLAKECLGVGLRPQAEDEIERVLEIDPANEVAKKALGAMHSGGK